MGEQSVAGIIWGEKLGRAKSCGRGQGSGNFADRMLGADPAQPAGPGTGLKQSALTNFFYFCFRFCLLVAGAAEAKGWAANCSERWTGSSWHEALNSVAAAMLGRDSGEVIYIIFKKLGHFSL